MSARAVLRGGLRLESHKTRPFEQPVQRLAPPATAVLALDQGSGEEARAIVPPGARVRMGSVVAAGRGAAADLHAPVSGTVRAIEPWPIVGGTGTCIVIDSDGRAEREPAAAPLAWEKLDGPALIERLAAGGLAGLGGAAFPTAGKLALARAAGVELLLLNGAECEPWICCDDALMRERAADIVLGARVMLAASGAARATITRG